MLAPITCGTCFSGIGAPEVALPEWDFKFCAEYAPDETGGGYAAKVLQHRYPKVPNLGDISAADFLKRLVSMPAVMVMIGGPPCQSYSIAGLRAGFNDSRGDLSFTWVEALHAKNIRFSITENVPGLLSANNGCAFGSLLAKFLGHDAPIDTPWGGWDNAGMANGPKGSVAWRILDSQYFGVPQRRRRLYIVCRHSGAADLHPCQILFEPARGIGSVPQSRTSWNDLARLGEGGVADGDEVRTGVIPEISDTVTVKWMGGSGGFAGFKEYRNMLPEISSTVVAAWSHGKGAHPSSISQTAPFVPEISETVPAHWAKQNHAGSGTTEYQNLVPFHIKGIRRIMPVEAERLQGFPDHHTRVPGMTDTRRYKAIGNAMSPPVMAVLGGRVEQAIRLADAA